MSAPEASENDIAVIGMSCHFPGARDIDEYWSNLIGGIESITPITEDDLVAEGVEPALRADPNYVRAGAILEGVDLFDPNFFGVSARDAAIMDPQHRHFLECVWEALESGGIVPATHGGSIGVFGGCGMGTYFMNNLLTNPGLLQTVGWFLLRHTGNDKDFLSTFASYKLNLRGPSVNVQTACSTSLVAIHMACQSLLSGECDVAVAGGSTIAVPHRVGYLFSEGEIMAPDGHCRAFDADAKGTIFGSGSGVVVLRRLADALEAGDHVWAVVKGSAINNDGASKAGYMAPSVEGQARAIAEALAVADVDARSIDYVEAHGTGTAVGDPIELAALTQAFRETTDDSGFCRIGSVKPNIGHLDTAAGVASFIKTVLALDRGQLPASLWYQRPNPEIDFERSPFRVNAEVTPWPRGSRPRRAGVSSLGVGGTNAHIVLEEAPAAMAATGDDGKLPLLVLSARSIGALDEMTARLVETLRQRQPAMNLGDVAHTLQSGRTPFEVRRAVACRDVGDAIEVLTHGDPQRITTRKVERTGASVAFLLPGGGAQYPAMGQGLYEHEPVYRNAVERGLQWLESHVEADWRELLLPTSGSVSDDARERLTAPSIQLPLIFVVEYALAKLWESWGIRPAALLGHSLGENTAACLAGVFEFEDALGLVTLRGRLFEEVQGGGMVSVNATPDDLKPLLGSDLVLAVINGPDMCVVSGPSAALAALERELQSREVEHQRLKISIAAHSPLLDPILGRFGDYLRGLRLQEPTIPIVSNVSGTWLRPEEATSPDYWVSHLRSTVRFADCLGTLLAGGERVLLEVGPGRTLSSLARQHPDAPLNYPVFPSLRHPDEKVSDREFLTNAFGRLWCAGVNVDWSAFQGDAKRRKVPLPTYPFERKSYWIKPGKVDYADRRETRVLTRSPNLDDWFYRVAWRPESRPKDGAPGKSRRWLVFVDDAGIGAAVCKQLRERGNEVIAVAEGDAYYRQGESQYLLAPEAGRKGYDALVADLVAHDTVPDRILHMWLLAAKPKVRPGSSLFHHHQERGFYSLLHLAQALGDEGLRDPLHITVFANGFQQIGDEAVLHPEKATLLGPARVMPREFPDITCSVVDVALPPEAPRRIWPFGRDQDGGQQSVADILRELDAPLANQVVALRFGQRFVQFVERVPALERPTDGAQPLRKGGCYMVTGGLGGIGLAMAKHLAESVQAKLVLLGRSSFPAAEQWDRWLADHGEYDRTSRKIRALRRLEEAGAQVMVESVDVANLDEMTRVIQRVRARFGPIHGVVHAAGVMDDGIIQLKTETSVENVLAPKVHGTLVLTQVLSEEKLDFMALFSSTSAVVAPAGQVDYVAANSFLNAVAHGRAHDSTHVVAVNWGVWKESGMAAQLRRELLGDDQELDAPHLTTECAPFDERVLSGGVAHYFWRVAHDGHWILDHHRTSDGVAVMPGTGYLELMRSSFADLTGGEGETVLSDVAFLEALAVPEAETHLVRVAITAGADGKYEVEVASRAEGALGAWRVHAQAMAHPSALEPAAKLDLAAIRSRCAQRSEACEAGGVIVTRQQEHLKFGGQWRVLRAVEFGEREALASLWLDPEHDHARVSHGLHPGIMDLATGCALPLVEGYDGFDGVYVPISYDRVIVRAPLTQQLFSHVRSRENNRVEREVVVFDVDVTDGNGTVLVQVQGYTMRKLVDTSALSMGAPHRPTTPSANLSAAEQLFVESVESGLTMSEGTQILSRVLADRRYVDLIVSPVDLHALIERTHEAGAGDPGNEATFARPNLASEYAAPTDEIEKTLVQYWQEFLGVDQIGIHDDFFELGGHSLIAVRLFAKVKKNYQVEYPISVLFEAPTIAKCADMIRQEIGEVVDDDDRDEPSQSAGFKHLVLMGEDRSAVHSPFFIVSGMFGNVLNLRHLAAHLAHGQSVYALQAAGLYGDEEPHDRFEEMARAYLAEVRQVQPHGPYFLGGFSGGGITALEMAWQLQQQGEETALVVMLDTSPPIVPQLTDADKAKIHVQRLRQHGPAYLARWARRRWEWESGRIRARLGRDEPQAEATPAEFRSENIRAAFVRALEAYEPPPYPGRIVLIRPPLDRSYILGPDRAANLEREIVDPYNHWKSYLPGEIEVLTVSGDHDSMVLEPHVRGLAAGIRARLEQARSGAPARSPAARVSASA